MFVSSKLKCLYLKCLPYPVFLQNKARRDDFCPRNLKNMHMVVDKLMAHSHLKYKGSKLQYSLHTWICSVQAVAGFKEKLCLMSKTEWRFGTILWIWVVSGLEIWRPKIVHARLHSSHNMRFVFRYIVHARLQYLPWVGAGLSGDWSQHVSPACAGEWWGG